MTQEELNQNFSAEWIKLFLERKHEDHKLRAEKGEEILRHASGKFDERLAANYQPSEPDWVLKYKKENYRAITKTFFHKVFYTISKIERAPDLYITFPDEVSIIKKGETLKDYTSEKFPYKVGAKLVRGDILNWLFDNFLYHYLTDPNGVCVYEPLKTDVLSTEYIEPGPIFYPSEKVWYFDDDFLIIKVEKDKEFIVYTKNEKIRFSKAKNVWNIEVLYEYDLGFIPGFFNGGVTVYEREYTFFESAIAGVVPYWDQALLDNNDFNAGKKMHAYPEKAAFATDNCPKCQGVGHYYEGENESRKQITCTTCSGTGVIKTGMFALHIQRPARGNETPPPDWAPVKYIEKDLEPIKFLKEDISQNLIDGLKAINMEFIGEKPMDQSGISKRYDWEQTFLFLYSIASHLCQNILVESYKIISAYRYNTLLPGKTDELIPKVHTPEKYDIQGVEEIEIQIGNMKKDGVDPMLISQLEKQYVSKKFAGDPDKINYLTAVIDLDPLRNVSEEEKMLRLSNKGNSLNEYVISSHIEQWVWKASEENKDFYSKLFDEQYEILKGYADVFIKEMTPDLMPTEEGGTPVDVEAEAKAKLKGTVGGVQGIIEINLAVGSGTMSEKSAELLLEEIYGFPPEISKRLIEPSGQNRGTPEIAGPLPGATGI